MLTSKKWDLSVHNGYWIGGHFYVPNLSYGYHGIMSQWWQDFFKPGHSALLVTESTIVKNKFSEYYPTITFKNLQFGEDSADYNLDLCKPWDLPSIEKFDAVICQATFEHLFNPVRAIENLIGICNPAGEIYLHTVTPGFPYHKCPQDYLRFYGDWFEDVTSNFSNIMLLDLVEKQNHIFARYKIIH